MSHNHPAFVAIKALSESVVKHYTSDIDIHDKQKIAEYPNSNFLFLYRETGSHLVIFGDGIDENKADFAEHLLKMNTHYAYWDGSKLSELDKDSAKDVIENNTVIAIGA